MGKLTDILRASGIKSNELEEAWENADSPPTMPPLPAGSYACRLEAAELAQSRSGKPAYMIRFNVLEGPGDETQFRGRKLWHDLYLTPSAAKFSKPELRKLGIQTLADIEKPMSGDLFFEVNVLLREGDDGRQFNRVIGFERIEPLESGADPYSPEAIEKLTADEYEDEEECTE